MPLEAELEVKFNMADVICLSFHGDSLGLCEPFWQAVMSRVAVKKAASVALFKRDLLKIPKRHTESNRLCADRKQILDVFLCGLYGIESCCVCRCGSVCRAALVQHGSQRHQWHSKEPATAGPFVTIIEL